MMRARTFRPMLDRLDARLLLDAASAAAAVQVAVAPASTPDDGIDQGGSNTWYVSGNPPVDTDDPTNPSIDLTAVPSTSTANC